MPTSMRIDLDYDSIKFTGQEYNVSLHNGPEEGGMIGNRRMHRDKDIMR